MANLLVRPASAIRGEFVTVTFSENVTVTEMASPILYVSSEPEFEVKLTDDTVGEVVSMVTVRLEDVEVTVESGNNVVDSAVMTLSPAVRTAVSHDQIPVVTLAVQVLPEDTPSTNNCTVDPTGAEPVNVSVVADVMLSVLVPVSSVASWSGVEMLGTA